jgi:hypothetical protein
MRTRGSRSSRLISRTRSDRCVQASPRQVAEIRVTDPARAGWLSVIDIYRAFPHCPNCAPRVCAAAKRALRSSASCYQGALNSAVGTIDVARSAIRKIAALLLAIRHFERECCHSVATSSAAFTCEATETLTTRYVVDGARRARTADLLGAIQALSQLSYSPVGEECSVSPRPANARASVSPDQLSVADAMSDAWSGASAARTAGATSVP